MKTNGYIDKALYNANQDFALNHNIDGFVSVKLNYAKSFSSVKGKFIVRLDNMITAWNIQDFKKFNEILLMSSDMFNHADFIHEYLLQCVKALKNQKSELIGNHFINERKKIDDLMNRLIKFNQVLVDSYGIESIDIETTPKYKKCQVYSIIVNADREKTIQIFDGFQFEYKGMTFQAYRDKQKKCTYIILPSCGISLNGALKCQVKVSHEFITDEIINVINDKSKVDNILSAEKMFIELMEKSGFDIPDVCKSIVKKDSIDLVNEITNESLNEIIDCSIERFSRRFGRIYNDLYNTDISGLEIDYTDKVALFDTRIEILKPILNAFVAFRKDFVSSDREAAAFILAIEYYYERGYNTIAGNEIPKVDNTADIESSAIELSIESNTIEPSNENSDTFEQSAIESSDKVSVDLRIDKTGCILNNLNARAIQGIILNTSMSINAPYYYSIMADKIRGSPINTL